LGNPLRFILTPGQVNYITEAEELITELSADHILADKGYDTKVLRETIVNQGAVPVIPPRKTSPQAPCYFALYFERNRVERFILKITHFRRIAICYQTPSAFLSILCLISVRLDQVNVNAI
jgi:transposase